jgi:ubiquitin C-terminal hydrolase
VHKKITDPPEILTFLINQKKVDGSYEPSKTKNVKVNCKDFLDLTERFLGNHEKPIMYKSFAVIDYIGQDNNAHYTAKCKDNDTESWYLFDDRSVTLLDNNEGESQWNNANNYMLFYKRSKDGSEGNNNGLEEDGKCVFSFFIYMYEYMYIYINIYI